jgi:hypothetical protein
MRKSKLGNVGSVEPWKSSCTMTDKYLPNDKTMRAKVQELYLHYSSFFNGTVQRAGNKQMGVRLKWYLTFDITISNESRAIVLW